MTMVLLWHSGWNAVVSVLLVPSLALADGQGRLKYQRNGTVTMDLRRTLWQWKLGNVLVFESERNIEAFRRRLQARNRTEDG
jgi:hypothetical protein